MRHFYVLTAGPDTFLGASDGDNFFQFTASTLQPSDRITGGPGAGFSDILEMTAPGTVPAGSFAGVNGIEQLLLHGGDAVTLTQSLVAGSANGYFLVSGGGSNNTVDASGVTGTVVILGGGGADTFTGGAGTTYYEVAAADLGTDTITGGSGYDAVRLTTAGTLAASAFANVSGIEQLDLAPGGGSSVTLTDGLFTGSSTGYLLVAAGGGGNTVDASGVTGTVVILGGGGTDTFTGGAGTTYYDVAAADLGTDTITGGSGYDAVRLTTAGTLAASDFAHVSGIEELDLAPGGNNVTLTQSLVNGSSTGYFFVGTGNGNNTLDASGVTTGAILVSAGTGMDSFTGGAGNDVFVTTAANVGSDTFNGNGGTDTLVLTTSGVVPAAALSGISNIEALALLAGGTVTLVDGLASSKLVVTGSGVADTVDGSAVASYAIDFHGLGGADTFIGGVQNDRFFVEDSNFASLNGGGGFNTIVLDAANQSFAVDSVVSKLAKIQAISLIPGDNESLTLQGGDIAQINSVGKSLYVAGGADATVEAGTGYTFLGSGVVNAAFPGETFNKYSYPGGSLLFLDSLIPQAGPSITSGGTGTETEGSATSNVAYQTTVTDPHASPTITYTLSGADAALFSISNTGAVTFNTSPDYESPQAAGGGNVYHISVTATDGHADLPATQAVAITVTDPPPSTPVDTDNAANTVAEGAALDTLVGITASSTVAGTDPAATYLITNDTSNGGFKIDSNTGVVSVADPTKIDYEANAAHSFDITVQASDGTLTSSQTFTVAVTDPPPSTPVDSDNTANTVAEGAALNTLVGVTASSSDPNDSLTYSISNDTSNGAFAIDQNTGVITVADPTKIDYEANAGHSFDITVQASDGTLTSSQTFTIAVTDPPPSTPVDTDNHRQHRGRRRRTGHARGDHGVVDGRRHRPCGDLSDHQRHLERRFQDRLEHRRGVRRRSDQDRLRGERRSQLRHHGPGERRYADELADLHHRGDRPAALDPGRQRQHRQHRGRKLRGRHARWGDGIIQ